MMRLQNITTLSLLWFDTLLDWMNNNKHLLIGQMQLSDSQWNIYVIVAVRFRMLQNKNISWKFTEKRLIRKKKIEKKNSCQCKISATVLPTNPCQPYFRCLFFTRSTLRVWLPPFTKKWRVTFSLNLFSTVKNYLTWNGVAFAGNE